MAIADLRAAANLWPLWSRLGWQDILHRYRRSALGPLWFTASTAISVLALGLVYSQIFNLPARALMPHVCMGLIVWNFVSSIFLDAGDLFTGSESLIRQIRLPFWLYAFRFIFAKTIAFAHDLPIYLALLAYLGLWPGWTALYAIPGLALLIINGAMASMTLGMVSARFRDIPRITASLMQIVFLITPIIWKPDMLGARIYISQANPFFHLIEIVRAPLLGTPPTLLNLVAVLMITLINCLATTVLFAKYRSRIAYWL